MAVKIDDLKNIVLEVEKKNGGPFRNLVLLCDAVEETRWARKRKLDVSAIKKLIEDQSDLAAHRKAMAEPGKSIPYEKVREELGLTDPPKRGRGRPRKNRAEASLQPMDLTEAEASVIDKSLADKSAQPKIKLAPAIHDEPAIEEWCEKLQSDTDYAGKLRRIFTPAGKCKVKLTGTSIEEVNSWAQAVRQSGSHDGMLYEKSALRYFVRDFYDYGTPEHVEVCQVINAL